LVSTVGAELRLNEYDADDIAKVIERRPLPSYEERMAVFLAYGTA